MIFLHIFYPFTLPSRELTHIPHQKGKGADDLLNHTLGGDMANCLIDIHQYFDGSEIRRSPVEVGNLPHDLQSFIHPRWLFGISSNTNINIYYINIKVSIWTTRSRVTAFIRTPKVGRTTTGPSRLTVQVLMQVLFPWSLIDVMGNLK